MSVKITCSRFATKSILISGSMFNTTFKTHRPKRSSFAFKAIGALFLVTLLFAKVAFGQSNPAAQTLPYSQNFTTLAAPTYPAGWQGWTVATASPTTIFQLAAPTADQALTVGTNASTGAGVYDVSGKIGLQATGGGWRALCLAITTTGQTNIVIAYDAATQRTENTRSGRLGLQYRIGNTGAFTNIAATEYTNQLTPTNVTGTGSVNVVPFNFYLPTACENQALVQLRWIMRDATGSGNRPSFSVDNVVLTPNVPPIVVNLNIFSPSSIAEGAGSFTIQATAASAVTADVTINIAITGTSATTASDFTLGATSVTILIGQTLSSTTTMAVENDDFNEGTEVVTVSITTPTSGYQISTGSRNVNFLDDANDAFYPLATLGSPAPTVDFNNLQNSGTTLSNYPLGFSSLESGTNANAFYRAGSGGNTGDTYSYGTGVSTERSFGSICSGSMGNAIGGFTDPPVVYGFRLRNTTGGPINTLDVSYVAELWRKGNATDDEIRFQYSTNASSVGTGTWTTVNALTFTPSLDIPGFAGFGVDNDRDGNLAANQANKTSSISLGTTIANNGFFWVRFFDYNSVNGDDGIGFDNIVFTPFNIVPTTFYSKPTGELTNVATWGTNTNGTGTAPANFTTAGQIFAFRNRATYTPLVNWTISGAGTKLVVNPGSEFIIPSGVTYTGDLDVDAVGKVTLDNASFVPSFVAIDPASTIQFSATTAQSIPAFAYGNLIVAGSGIKTFSGASINIAGNLTLNNVATNYGTGSFIIQGNVTFSGTVTNTVPTNTNTYNFTGTKNQTVSLNSNTVNSFNFIVNKTAGTFTLAANSPVFARNTFRANVTGTAKFIDGGNTITASNNIELDGTSAANYILTGTTTLDFNQTGGTGNVRRSNSDNRAAIGQFNNLVLLNNGTGGSTDILIRGDNSLATVVKGNLSIGGASTLGGVDQVNFSRLNIGGAFINSRVEAPLLLSQFQGKVYFTGTGPVLITTQTTAGVKIQRFDSLFIQRPGTSISIDGGLELDGGIEGSGVNNYTISQASPFRVRFFGGVSSNAFKGRFTIPRVSIENTSASGVLFSAAALMNITQDLSFVTNGKVTTTAGTLVLKSTSLQTAGIPSVVPAGASIIGGITAERFVPTSGWHFTGTALAGQTISDWNDDFRTQGPMPGVRTPNPGSNTSSIFAFDPNSTLNDGLRQKNGWIVPTTSALEQFKGYRVNIQAGTTLDNRGDVNFAPGPIPVVLGTGTEPNWNLVQNPHLSGINVAAINFNAAQNAVVVWNQSANQYQYAGTPGPLTGPTLNGALNTIASGQAFFVYTTATTTIDVPQSAKVAGGTFLRTAQTPNAPEIQIRNSAGAMDATVFQFLSNASEDYENNVDAVKFINPDLSIYTISQGKKLAINGLPFSSSNSSILLGFKVNAPGNYTISAAGIELTNHAERVYLKDNYENVITALNAEPNYNFSADMAGDFNDRFELIFTQDNVTLIQSKVGENTLLYPNPVESGKPSAIAFFNSKGETARVSITDMSGRIFNLQTAEIKNNYQEMQLSTEGLASGIYLVNIVSGKGTKVEKLVIR